MPRRVDHNIQLNPSYTELPKNNEDYQLIWLDGALTQSSYARPIEEMLRSLSKNVQFYTDVNKCIQLISNVSIKHILLVISGSFAHIVLPQIHKRECIRSVFIFCEVREFYLDLLDEYPLKVVDIYTDRINLVKSIFETIKLLEKQEMTFRLFHCEQKLTRKLTNESKLFLMNQFWIHVLTTMPADERAKNEMLEYCSDYYQHNSKQLKKIKSFRRSYTSNDAIKYYRANSFLYKLLNKALRNEDIQVLYKLRFFIIDLCAQLENGKERLVSNGPTILYRNQPIPKEKFEHLTKNIGALVTFNDFLLTSHDENIFRQISKLPSWNHNIVHVQIAIQVDPTTLKKVALADVNHPYERNKPQQDVLFSIGTTFRIDTSDFDETLSLGKLTLIATDEGSAMLQSYLDVHKDQLDIYSLLICFGRYLLGEMGDIDRAAQYFRMLLDTLPSDHPDMANVYNQIGSIHYMNSHAQSSMRDSELNHALEMFEKALEIRQIRYGDHDVRIASSLSNIGSVYNDHGEYDHALDYYGRGLQILDNAKVEIHIFKANLLTNYGILKQRTDDYESALCFYIKADDMLSQLLHVQHPIHIKRKLQIVELCKYIGDLSRALQYNQQAFEYGEGTLLLSDKQFKDLWINVVRCSLQFGHKQEAITYLNRILKICEQDSISNDYIWSMAQLCTEAMDFDLALDYYKTFYRSETMNITDFSSTDLSKDSDDSKEENSTEQYIKILKFKISAYEKLFPVNDSKHASFLTEMSRLFISCQSTDLACQCYQKALDIYEVLPMSIHANAFKSCWRELIDIYFINRDQQAAINVLERALKTCKENLPNNDLNATGCLQYIADKYAEYNDIYNALEYLDKAFTYAEKTSSYGNILSLLESVLDVCEKNDKKPIIETFINRAVKIWENDCVQLIKCHRMLGESYCHVLKFNKIRSSESIFIEKEEERKQGKRTEIKGDKWISNTYI